MIPPAPDSASRPVHADVAMVAPVLLAAKNSTATVRSCSSVPPALGLSAETCPVGDAARNLLAAAIVIAIGVAMGFRPDGGPVGVLLAVALLLGFSFSMAWIWTALALVLRTPSAVSNVSLLFVFPLTFASNVFVEPRTMPGCCRPSSTPIRSATWSPRSAASWPAPRRPARSAG